MTEVFELALGDQLICLLSLLFRQPYGDSSIIFFHFSNLLFGLPFSCRLGFYCQTHSTLFCALKGVKHMTVQRIYETNLDFETVKAQILRNRKDFQYRGDVDAMKLLSFRLPAFPANLIQLTPKKQFLMLHGLRPYSFLQDLRIMKALVQGLRDRYPKGIQFKLYKERIPSRDKDVMIEREHMISRFHRVEIRVLQSGREERHQAFLSAWWRITKNNEQLRSEFAEDMNNAMAQWLCLDGICCTLDGSIIPFSPGSVIPIDQRFSSLQSLRDLENTFAQILQISGFLS